MPQRGLSMSERQKLIARLEMLEGAFGFGGKIEEMDLLHQIRVLLNRDEDAMREAVFTIAEQRRALEAALAHELYTGPGTHSLATEAKLTEALK